VDVVTSPKKTSSRQELERIEDALVRSILDAPTAEIREEMAAAGEDPNKAIAEFDDIIARAKAAGARKRMADAKNELAAWRTGKGIVAASDRKAVLARLEAIKARHPDLASKMMMAAREGEGASDRDIEEVLEALAKLERLEGEDGEQ
jgi:uncharacterized protein with von Willebrand factor type A (vWA) domain